MTQKTAKLIPSQALNRPLYRQADDNTEILKEKEVLTRRLGFNVGNLGLLIAQKATCELTELLDICAIPFTASWLLGLINLRGNLIPIFDLHRLLQFEPVEAKKLLILGQGNAAGGIIIDNLPIHINFTETDKLTHLPPLPPIIKPYSSSGFEKEGQLWFNFDHQGFFESIAAKIAL
jgi:twitching motility protein PilI